GRHEHLVARLDAERLQADANRIGTGANTTGLELQRGPVIRGKLGFEALELGPHEEVATVEDTRDSRVELGSNSVDARLEGGEGDLDTGRHTAAATGSAAQ